MSETTRTAPLALWRIAETFLHTLFNLFGAPEDVARQHTFTHAPYVLLLSWIRAGEALLRRLLLIEAAAYSKPNTRPLLHISRPRKRRRSIRPTQPPASAPEVAFEHRRQRWDLR